MLKALRAANVRSAFLLLAAWSVGWTTAPAGMEFQARQGEIRIRQSAEFELTGDDRLETVTVTATGDDWHTLRVRLEIRTSDGSSLYASEWESVRYFNRSPGAEREQVVRGAISAVVGDQRALQADMVKRGHPISAETEMRDAVEWDLVEEAFPKLAEGAGNPGEYSRRVREARQRLPQERVDALMRELRDQPKFVYLSGNETHTGIAWSNTEARFVRVYLCC